MPAEARVIIGDCRSALLDVEAGSVKACLTSPPYLGSPSYLHPAQPEAGREMGTEKTSEEYIGKLVEVFALVHRALREDGVLWLAIGDTDNTFGGPLAVPGRVAHALCRAGWFLRHHAVWRPAGEMNHAFLFGKAPGGRNELDRRELGDHWTFARDDLPTATFPTLPQRLVELLLVNGTEAGDLVLDPFCGSGSVLLGAQRLRRRSLGIELDPRQAWIAEERLA